MKNFFVLCVFFISACGGGSVGGSQSGSAKVVRTSNLRVSPTSTLDFVALTPASSFGSTVVARLINFFGLEAFADNLNGPETLVGSEKLASDVKPILSIPLEIRDFTIPTVSRTGKKYIVFSGDLSGVKDPSGSEINCAVIVAQAESIENPVCVWRKSPGEADIYPTGIIRDGNSGGYVDSEDSVYFVVNKSSSGFDIYKYYKNSLILAKSSSDGKITKIISGDTAIYGFDEYAGAVTKTVFGSYNKENQPGLGLEINEISEAKNAVQVDGKYMVRTNIPNPSNGGKFTAFYDLILSTSTSYANDFSADCDVPQSQRDVGNHSYGSIWLSRANNRICEAYILDGRPEKVGTRWVGTAKKYIEVKSINNYVAAIYTEGPEKILVIDAISPNTNIVNGNEITRPRSIDESNKLSIVNLDSVDNIGIYVNGFIISGMKDGLSATRLYNVNTRSLEESKIQPLSEIKFVR